MYPNTLPDSPISPRSRASTASASSPPHEWVSPLDAPTVEIPDLPIAHVEGVPAADWQRLGDMAVAVRTPTEEETFVQLYYYKTTNPAIRGDEKIADVLFIFKQSVALRMGINPRKFHHMTGHEAIGMCLDIMQCAYDTGVYAAMASSNSIDCTPATFLRYCVQVYTESNIVPSGMWFVADM